jgi:hypothetical protein
VYHSEIVLKHLLPIIYGLRIPEREDRMKSVVSLVLVLLLALAVPGHLLAQSQDEENKKVEPAAAAPGAAGGAAVGAGVSTGTIAVGAVLAGAALIAILASGGGGGGVTPTHHH